MFSSGIYKNRLYKILISTGTIVIVLLAVLSGSYLHLQQKSSYIHNLSNSTAALEANSNIAMNLISRAVNDVSRDQSLTKWVILRQRFLFQFHHRLKAAANHHHGLLHAQL